MSFDFFLGNAKKGYISLTWRDIQHQRGEIYTNIWWYTDVTLWLLKRSLDIQKQKGWEVHKRIFRYQDAWTNEKQVWRVAKSKSVVVWNSDCGRQLSPTRSHLDLYVDLQAV